jgi:hypothetical protein
MLFTSWRCQGKEKPMLPSLVLNGKAENGVMTIAAYGAEAHQIKLIGASMKTSLPSGSWCESFSLELGDEERGVVAVVVPCFYSRNRIDYPFFFEVKKNKDDKKIEFDFTEPFVPSPGTLGQIDKAGRITVDVNGDIYTNDFPQNHDSSIHPKYHFVDPDSLCRYLVKKITAQQLKEASISSCISNTLEQRLAAREKSLELLDQELADANKRIQGLDEALAKECRQHIETWRLYQELKSKRDSEIDTLWKFGREVLLKRLFSGNTLYQAFAKVLPKKEKITAKR